MTMTEADPINASSFAALADLFGVPGLERHAWRAFGLCRTRPDLDWFPERGVPVAEQKAVCAACPVREACLDASLAGGERFGIWGGLAESDRRRHGGRVPRVPDLTAATIAFLADLPGRRWDGTAGALGAAIGGNPNTMAQAVLRMERRGLLVVDPPDPRPQGFPIRSITLAGAA